MHALKKKLKSSGRYIADKFVFPIRPRRQFRRLMIAATVLFAVVFALHIYLFYRIQSGSMFQGVASPTAVIPAVNETKLATVLLRFEDKAVIRSAALGLVPAVSDPSR